MKRIAYLCLILFGLFNFVIAKAQNVIRIHEARYGDHRIRASFIDVKEKVKERCENMRKCQFTPSNEWAGQDPKHGFYKYLEVGFFCVQRVESGSDVMLEHKSFRMMEGGLATLDCEGTSTSQSSLAPNWLSWGSKDSIAGFFIALTSGVSAVFIAKSVGLVEKVDFSQLFTSKAVTGATTKAIESATAVANK